MGITPKDIAAQRAMLERGEAIRKSREQREEQVRLRDTFAAAALTGLLSRSGIHYTGTPDDNVREMYRWADAMLREREKSRAGQHGDSAANCPERDRVTEPPKEKRADVSDRSYEKSDEKRVLSDMNHDAAPTIESALETLSRAIGVYGKRIDSPFSIRWSNGITAFVNGTFVGGGRGNVARAIAEYGMPDMSKKDATNHDAAPAAKAQTESAAGEPGGGGGCGGTDKPVTLPARGTGNTQEPVAWAVFRWWDNTGVAAFCQRDEADDWRALETAGTCHRHDVVPLYRAPTLTADEREAIEYFANFQWTMLKPHAATLRSLLQRLGETNG